MPSHVGVHRDHCRRLRHPYWDGCPRVSRRGYPKEDLVVYKHTGPGGSATLGLWLQKVYHGCSWRSWLPTCLMLRVRWYWRWIYPTDMDRTLNEDDTDKILQCRTDCRWICAPSIFTDSSGNWSISSSFRSSSSANQLPLPSFGILLTTQV